jgi:hypothetical protein
LVAHSPAAAQAGHDASSAVTNGPTAQSTPNHPADRDMPF